MFQQRERPCVWFTTKPLCIIANPCNVQSHHYTINNTKAHSPLCIK